MTQIRTFVGFLMANHGNIRRLIHEPSRTEVNIPSAALWDLASDLGMFLHNNIQVHVLQ